MNRPDKAAEPSMEEILASIRQIIADEPSGDQAEPAIEANPLVPQSSPASKPTEARLPLADRLNGVLKSGTLPPTSPLGSKRPLSFDQDLADILDEQEPANGSSVVAPKPDIRVAPELSHPMVAKAFVPPSAGGAKSATDGTAALPPQLAPPASQIPPPPFGTAERATVAPPRTFGFPPLRKTSFYPPQPKAPAPPTSLQSDLFASASAPEPKGADAGAPYATLAGGGDASKPVVDGLGPAAPGATGASAGASLAPSPLSAGSAAAAEQRHTPDIARGATAHGEGQDAPLSPFAPSPASAAPAQTQLGGLSPDRPFGAAPEAFGAVGGAPVAATPDATFESRPSAPRGFPDPFAGSARAAPGFSGQSPYAMERDTSSVAAHQALDALAQGLAASAAASSASAETVSPAIPLTPVIEEVREEDHRGAYAPSTLPAPVASAGSPPVARTLEDAVADMLRPMLQQWVADNMPRIIERALRTEVARTAKPGQKPPGT